MQFCISCEGDINLQKMSRFFREKSCSFPRITQNYIEAIQYIVFLPCFKIRDSSNNNRLICHRPDVVLKENTYFMRRRDVF